MKLIGRLVFNTGKHGNMPREEKFIIPHTCHLRVASEVFMPVDLIIRQLPKRIGT